MFSPGNLTSWRLGCHQTTIKKQKCLPTALEEYKPCNFYCLQNVLLSLIYMCAHMYIGVYLQTCINYVYTQINQSLGLSVYQPIHILSNLSRQESTEEMHLKA